MDRDVGAARHRDGDVELNGGATAVLGAAVRVLVLIVAQHATADLGGILRRQHEPAAVCNRMQSGCNYIGGALGRPGTHQRCFHAVLILPRFPSHPALMTASPTWPHAADETSPSSSLPS